MKKISYKGRELPCRMTMGALVRFKRETGRDVSAIQNGDISDLVTLLWCSIASACHADGVSFDEPFDMFADSLDADVLEAFIKDLAGNADGEPQKKMTAQPEK